MIGDPCEHCRIKTAVCADHCKDPSCDCGGRIRGWLCNECNSSVGKLGDTASELRRMVEYLERDHSTATKYSTYRSRRSREISGSWYSRNRDKVNARRRELRATDDAWHERETARRRAWNLVAISTKPCKKCGGPKPRGRGIHNCDRCRIAR